MVGYFQGNTISFINSIHMIVFRDLSTGDMLNVRLSNLGALQVALAPDQDYDQNGCFSGSAIVKDNRLWLMYTGHIQKKPVSASAKHGIFRRQDSL